jgi:hypothetical protein
MPHALRLEPFIYAAVTGDQGIQMKIQTDERFPTAF